MTDHSQAGGSGFQASLPGRVGGRFTHSSRPLSEPARTFPMECSAAGARNTQEIRWYQWLILSIVLVLFVGGLFAFAVYMAVRQNQQASEEQAAFEAVMRDFLVSPVRASRGATLPRLGKVVLVDVEKGTFDRLHLNLPEDLRARTPQEATTIAQMRYVRKQVGHYEGGARAIQLSCIVTVIDRPSRTVLATRSFDWDKPPVSIPRTGSSEDVTGSPPMKEITSFLAGLR